MKKINIKNRKLHFQTCKYQILSYQNALSFTDILNYHKHRILNSVEQISSLQVNFIDFFLIYFSFYKQKTDHTNSFRRAAQFYYRPILSNGDKPSNWAMRTRFDLEYMSAPVLHVQHMASYHSLPILLIP